MLITALTKLCSEVCSFFFQHHSGNNMSSVNRKLNIKILGEKFQALKGLEKGPQTKTTVKNMMHPVVKPSSIEITNVLSTLQNLCLFHDVGNDILELLQRSESLHVHDAARKQSSILTYFNRT